MRKLETRIEHRLGKWHVLVRNGTAGAVEAAWTSLGGCSGQMTAFRVWLACQGQGKR